MAIYRIPFDASDTAWSSGTGNWDDPTDPHPQGDGNYPWGDGYAKDFGRPVDPTTKVGGRVLAARAGFVQSVVDSIGPWQPPDAGGYGGDPGGNQVLIQHADGTIGVYAHLAQNSVRVTVGQYVFQGGYIADSGDTGNTGGAGHLHFSVLTYIKDDLSPADYGPTVPIHFEATAASNYQGTPTDPNPPPNPYFFRARNAGTVTSSPIYYRQDGWRNCGKCQGLYFDSTSGSPPVRNTGVCPVDGQGHSQGGGGNYQLLANFVPAPPTAQQNWRWCRKCSIMFYPNPGSVCPADHSTHDGSVSANYMPILNTDDASNLGQAQSQWKYCSKCKAMFFGPNKASSKCPSDNGNHDDSISGNYLLKVNNDDVQRGWRRCGKCQSIFYSRSGVTYCPVTTPSNSHTVADNRDYMFAIDCADAAPGATNASPAPFGQQGWRWCNRCSGLWFPNSGSVCPAPGGGNHASAGSSNYALYTYWSGTLNGYPSFSPGETGWSWCNKCQSMWNGTQQASSKCPADGQNHSFAGSGNYTIQYSTQ
jgi:hypothetical protein